MAAGSFLVVAIVGLLFTLNALAPRSRPVSVLGFSFFAAWLTSELAVFHLAWQLVATIVFVAAGALRSWPGWIALVLTVLSWCGLVRLIVVATRTGALMDTALADALGDGYANALPESLRDPRLGAVSWRHVFWPSPRRRGVEKVRNLAYVDDGNKRHRLDVYRPLGGTTAAPVLLQIHGGGWMIGTKDQQGLPLMYQMAAHGWVCVAINYRLSPRATWPDHLVDCKTALAWIKTHIEEYGGDPERVVVTGGSAGGHLAALLGLTANEAQFQPGFETVDTSVRAFVPIYAVFDFTDREGIRGRRDPLRKLLERHVMKRVRTDDPDAFEIASPMHHVRDGVPPGFVVHGRLDTLVPVEEARHFVSLLRPVSTEPVAYAELPGTEHAFDVFASIRSLLAITRIERFATWAVSAPVERLAAPSTPATAAGDAAPSTTGPTTTVRMEP